MIIFNVSGYGPCANVAIIWVDYGYISDYVPYARPSDINIRGWVDLPDSPVWVN